MFNHDLNIYSLALREDDRKLRRNVEWNVRHLTKVQLHIWNILRSLCWKTIKKNIEIVCILSSLIVMNKLRYFSRITQNYPLKGHNNDFPSMFPWQHGFLISRGLGVRVSGTVTTKLRWFSRIMDSYLKGCTLSSHLCFHETFLYIQLLDIVKHV